MKRREPITREQELRARVEALGYRLVRREHVRDVGDPGLYVVDVERSRFVLTPTGHGLEADLVEVDSFCGSAEHIRDNVAPTTIDPSGACLFASRFAGVELRYLHLTSLRNTTLVGFVGDADQLLTFGLIDEHMLAQHPKRVAYSCRDDSSWRTRRAARGRIEVDRRLARDFPPDHPLGALAPSNWPLMMAATAWAIAREQRHNARVVPLAGNGATSRPPYLRLVIDNENALR